MIGSFFKKNMPSGFVFLICLGLLVTFLCHFVSQERLSTCSVSWGPLGGLGCQNPIVTPIHWTPFGSISASLFEQNCMIFMLFFDCFSGCIFCGFLVIWEAVFT